MKKLTLIFVALTLAILAVAQTSTLIEYPYVVKHMSNKDQIFTGTPGKYFVGYSPISQGDSVLYYSSSGLSTGLGTYASPLPIDSINTLQSNGKKVLARIKRGDTYGTITLADSNIVVCSYSTVNTTAKPVINYVDYNGKTNIEVKNIDLTYDGYYFVSNAGNDLYPGTSPDSAWATIAKVNAATFNAGDNILFNRGDEWRGESITVGWSGTESNPITFGAYGTGAKPIINGASVITTWNESPANVWRTLAPIRTENVSSFYTVVVIDGQRFMPVTNLAALNADLEYLVVNKTGTANDSIYVYSTTNPATRVAELSTKMTGVYGGQKKYITVKDLEFRYYGYAGVDFRDAAEFGHCLIDNCTFYHNKLTGVQLFNGHGGNIVQNSTSTYNGNGFYTNISDSNSFINNTVTNTISYAIASGGLQTDGHGIGAYKSDNTLIEGNYMENNQGSNIGYDTPDASFPNSGIIRYNTFKANSNSSGSCLGANAVAIGSTLNIYYNTVYNDKNLNYGLNFNNLTGGKINIYNNTIIQTGNVDAIIRLNYADSITLKNNIIFNKGVLGVGLLWIYYNSEPTSNNNLWYNEGTISVFAQKRAVANYNTLAAWTAATAEDANSLNTDPFLTTEFTNLQLQTGSPAINAGINVGLTRDILGNPVPAGEGYDIGAYEKQP